MDGICRERRESIVLNFNEEFEKALPDLTGFDAINRFLSNLAERARLDTEGVLFPSEELFLTCVQAAIIISPSFVEWLEDSPEYTTIEIWTERVWSDTVSDLYSALRGNKPFIQVDQKVYEMTLPAIWEVCLHNRDK